MARPEKHIVAPIIEETFMELCDLSDDEILEHHERYVGELDMSLSVMDKIEELTVAMVEGYYER